MEDNFWEFEEYDKDLVERFEKMVQKNENYFFDTEEFESIINYYMHKNNMSRCEIALRKAMLQHPNSTIITLKKVHFLICNNHLERALGILTKLEHVEPENIDVLMAKACIFSQQNEHYKAIREYEKVLSIEPGCMDVNMFLAQEYETIGELSMAESCYMQELKNDWDTDYVLPELHYLYEQQEKEEAFITFILNYIKTHPFSWIAWEHLGLTYYNLTLYEKAIEAFSYVSAINEQYIYAYLYTANSLFYLEQYDQAIDIALMALQYQNSPVLFCVIGDCYKEKNELDKAVFYFQEALKQDDEYPYGHINLALCYFENNENETSLLHLQKALKIDDTNADFLRIASEIYSGLQMKDEACYIFNRLLTFEPNDTESWIDFADFLYTQGEIIEALDTLEKGLLQNPHNANFLYRMAAIHFLKGNELEGICFLQEAIQNNPDASPLLDFAPELAQNATIIEILNNNNK